MSFITCKCCLAALGFLLNFHAFISNGNGAEASDNRHNGGKSLRTNQCEKRAGKRRALEMEAIQLVTSPLAFPDVACEAVITQTNQHRGIP